MKRKILIFDTSVLLVYLNVPGRNVCNGPLHLTHEIALETIEEKTQNGYDFVLPVACVIEAGNHIAQCSQGNRHNLAGQLIELVQNTANGVSPWILFSDNLDIWHPNNLKWIDNWADYAVAGLSLADRTISSIADDYSQRGFEVEIFTCDEQLKAYQPAPPLYTPRRRKTN